jgi:ferredoxin
VKACPTDSFREGINTLVIDPVSCIDCDACAPVCPTAAISKGDGSGAKGWDFAEWKEYIAFYAAKWPTINKNKEPMEGADDVANAPGKVKFFDPNPWVA